MSRILFLLFAALLGACHFDVSAVAEVHPSSDAGTAKDADRDAGPEADAAVARDAPAGAHTMRDAGLPLRPDAGQHVDAPAPTVAAPEACAPDLVAGAGDGPVTAPGGVVELARWQTPTMQDRALGPVARLGSRRAWILSRRYAAAATTTAGTPANEPLVAWDDPAETRWASEPPSTRGDPLLILGIGDMAGTVGFEPTSLVTRAGGGGLLFGLRWAGIRYEGVWIADLAEDGAAAGNRRHLFGSGEPLFAFGAIRTRDHLTVYACDPSDLASPCYAARVPNGAEDRRDAYQVRTQDELGSWTWSSDLRRGTALLKGVDKDLSILFSPYLQRYVAVHGAPRERGRAFLVLHTAPAPEGPWTEQLALILPQTPVWWPTHVRVHEALSDPCGKRLVFSYFAATRGTDDAYRFPVAGETVLGAIELMRP